jgi:hypothetical protein
VRRFEERCEFWSVRSRWTWRLIGLFAIVLFGILGIEGATQGNKHHANEALLFSIVFVGLACGVGLFLNALRAGHLTLTEDRLIYHGVFGNHRFKRSQVQDAHTGSYSPPNNSRIFNVPFILRTDGRTIRLTEFASPMGPEMPTLDAHIWLEGGQERTTESIDGLVDWINSWASYTDWINDSTRDSRESSTG